MRNAKSNKNHDESEESSEDSSDSKKNEVKFECEICSGSFHPSHVPLPKTKTSQPTSLHDIKFLCPSCLRSRRPRIELILSLLMNYEKISVKLPEGKFKSCYLTGLFIFSGYYLYWRCGNWDIDFWPRGKALWRDSSRTLHHTHDKMVLQSKCYSLVR